MHTQKENIIAWLHTMEITEYTLNEDLSVNTEYVDISNHQLKEIPVQFNKTKNFDCSRNELVSLKGVPRIVEETFVCSKNLLTSLEFSPTEVGENFHCSDNLLRSLHHSPRVIGHNFFCLDNPELNNLKGIGHVKQNIMCQGNIFPWALELENIDDIKIDGYIVCYNAPKDIFINHLSGNVLVNRWELLKKMATEKKYNGLLPQSTLPNSVFKI